MLCFRLTTALVFLASAAAAQSESKSPEKVRVAYEASAGCPGSDVFLAQVRERVGTGWEAPPNVLARTIEVRVTGGGDRSIARIDFVDENQQPITRVVTAKTCDEVVTGIALVTALAIESRIAEAVGKSEPAPATDSTAPASEVPGAERAPEAPNVLPSPLLKPAPPPQDEPGPTPRYEVGAGLLMSFGALPQIPTFGFHTFLGLAWRSGFDVRVGFDQASSGIVQKVVNGHEYQSSFSLNTFHASVCPLALGSTIRLLPCGGLEAGWLAVSALDSSSPDLTVRGGDYSPAWLAPVASLRGDATWDVFFAELQVSFAVPIFPKERDFVFERTATTAAGVTTTSSDTVHTIWPVVPSASLSLGLRL